MSYLDAPQTAMLATHCCVCGRPLCDARSVELGIGPECGEALHALSDLGEDQRRLANRLTWAASVYATQGRIGEVRRCAQAIRALGLDGLASTIEERFHGVERKARIKVWRNGDQLWFETPFRRGEKVEFLTAMRALPGRKYVGSGVNAVPLSSKRQLWAFLTRFFPGQYGTSDEGVFRVPATA